MQKQHCCSLERTLALLWALWLSMAAFTNICDLLVKLEHLPKTWMLKSGNLAFLMDYTKGYQFSEMGHHVAFGVIAGLQVIIALIFWRAVFSRECKGACCGYHMMLWIVGFFLIADEFFLQGANLHLILTQHFILFSAILLSKFSCGSSSKCAA